MIIYNKAIPFKGFKAINFFGIIFARSECKPLDNKCINHENIHTEQIKEMLFIFFYIWYLIEYLIKLVKYMDTYAAYRNISFEKEAYNNQRNFDYIENRKHFNWLKRL